MLNAILSACNGFTDYDEAVDDLINHNKNKFVIPYILRQNRRRWGSDERFPPFLVVNLCNRDIVDTWDNPINPELLPYSFTARCFVLAEPLHFRGHTLWRIKTRKLVVLSHIDRSIEDDADDSEFFESGVDEPESENEIIEDSESD